jgi:hypothetical protein
MARGARRWLRNIAGASLLPVQLLMRVLGIEYHFVRRVCEFTKTKPFQCTYCNRWHWRRCEPDLGMYMCGRYVHGKETRSTLTMYQCHTPFRCRCDARRRRQRELYHAAENRAAAETDPRRGIRLRADAIRRRVEYDFDWRYVPIQWLEGDMWLSQECPRQWGHDDWLWDRAVDLARLDVNRSLSFTRLGKYKLDFWAAVDLRCVRTPISQINQHMCVHDVSCHLCSDAEIRHMREEKDKRSRLVSVVEPHAIHAARRMAFKECLGTLDAAQQHRIYSDHYRLALNEVFDNRQSFEWVTHAVLRQCYDEVYNVQLRDWKTIARTAVESFRNQRGTLETQGVDLLQRGMGLLDSVETDGCVEWFCSAEKYIRTCRAGGPFTPPNARDMAHDLKRAIKDLEDALQSDWVTDVFARCKDGHWDKDWDHDWDSEVDDLN